MGNTEQERHNWPPNQVLVSDDRTIFHVPVLTKFVLDTFDPTPQFPKPELGLTWPSLGAQALIVNFDPEEILDLRAWLHRNFDEKGNPK